MPNVEVTPKVTFSWESFVQFIENLLSYIFNFIAEEEGWVEE